MIYGSYHETRTYNDLYQLTRLTDTLCWSHFGVQIQDLSPPASIWRPNPKGRTLLFSWNASCK